MRRDYAAEAFQIVAAAKRGQALPIVIEVAHLKALTEQIKRLDSRIERAR